MKYYKKFFGHLKTVLTHKYWVFYYCYHCGIPWQGIKHDLSKFSPTEFFESVKYYSGTRSPIDACKEDIGISQAWFHHKGHNKHHYEYWQDNFDFGGTPVMMPLKYAIEALCDSLGAGRAYMGDKFSLQKEYEWWLNKKSKPLAMHPQTILFFDKIFTELKDKRLDDGVGILDYDHLRVVYNMAKLQWEDAEREKINGNTNTRQTKTR